MPVTVPVIPARFADPPAPPTAVKIVSRWEQFLGALATGVKVEDAMLQCYIKRREIQAMISSAPSERKRYQEAKVTGLRQAYSDFDLDEFFNRLAMGGKVADAFMEVFGMQPPTTFYEILRSDPDMEERYANALKTRSVLEVENVLSIVDESDNDVLMGDKGPVPNNAAVNRSKLRAETRMRMASVWYRRIFGEKETTTNVNVQVNHAVVLEEARARARDQRMTPRRVEEFTEGVFTSVPKEQPMDTTWMEEK